MSRCWTIPDQDGFNFIVDHYLSADTGDQNKISYVDSSYPQLLLIDNVDPGLADALKTLAQGSLHWTIAG